MGPGVLPADAARAARLLDVAIADHRTGRLEAAVAGYSASIALRPDQADAHSNLGFALKALGRLVEAEASCRRALEIDPGHVGAHNNLGIVLYDLGRLDEAESSLRQAIAIRPDYAEAHNNLGNTLRGLGRPAEAAACLHRALELAPGYADAYSNLGNALRDLGRHEAAEESFRCALAIDPASALAHNNLGNVLRELGRPGEALIHLERAIALEPGAIAAHMNILTTLVYDPSADAATVYAAHRRFEDQMARPLYPHARAHASDRDPGRRLRIAYLSADFRAHSAARTLLPMFRSHDRAAFEIHLYAEVRRPDDVTADFRELADGWHPTIGIGDRDVAEAIRSERIDILVSLAGRFDGNRPLVCAYRPAPIQISSHDVATSGLSAIDYLLADPVLVPRRGPERFAERVLRLPGFYLAEMPDDLPPVLPRCGPPVFGCFNNPAKVSDAALDLWARLLGGVPGAKLVLRYNDWYDAVSLRARVHSAFDRHSIDRARVSFPPAAATHRAHLESHADIDVALDTFPFSGSTTSFDALLMGVPVVTLTGWSMVGRWTATMLVDLGLRNLIADSPAAYVDIVQALAKDRGRLAALRAGLRTRVARSPLCDAPHRVRRIERFYRAAWRRWCATEGV